MEQPPRYEPVAAKPVVRETVVRQVVEEPAKPVPQPQPVSEVQVPQVPQPAENSVEAQQSASVDVQPTQKKKKVVKMIVVYDDRSFVEYYPE